MKCVKVSPAKEYMYVEWIMDFFFGTSMAIVELNIEICAYWYRVFFYTFL